jgi:hypothetical protein
VRYVADAIEIGSHNLLLGLGFGLSKPGAKTNLSRHLRLWKRVASPWAVRLVRGSFTSKIVVIERRKPRIGRARVPDLFAEVLEPALVCLDDAPAIPLLIDGNIYPLR